MRTDGLQIAHLMCVFSPVIPGRWPLGDSAEDSCVEAARDCKCTGLSGSCRCRSESLSTLGRRHCPRWGAGTVDMSMRTSEAPVFVLLFSLCSRGG